MHDCRIFLLLFLLERDTRPSSELFIPSKRPRTEILCHVLSSFAPDPPNLQIRTEQNASTERYGNGDQSYIRIHYSPSLLYVHIIIIVMKRKKRLITSLRKFFLQNIISNSITKYV